MATVKTKNKLKKSIMIINAIKERVDNERLVDYFISDVEKFYDLKNFPLFKCYTENSQKIILAPVKVTLTTYLKNKNKPKENHIKAFRQLFEGLLKTEDEKYSLERAEFVNWIFKMSPFKTSEEFEESILNDGEVFADSFNKLDNEDPLKKHIIEFIDLFKQVYNLDDAMMSKLNIDTAKIDCDKLNDKIEELEEEISKLKTDNDKLKSENEKLAEKKKKASDKDKKYKDEIESLKAVLKEKSNESAKLALELQEKNEKILALEKDVEDYKNKTDLKAEPKAEDIIVDKINEADFINSLMNVLSKDGLYYSRQDLYNFHIACKSSQLTILAGPSGIGKTRLPLAYAKCINANEKDGTLLFMPVSPAYTEPGDVLGYYNPTEKKFCPSDTGLTDILKHAMDNPDKMHIVIFDEMNLSQIEYWFAPFMSILERPEDDRRIVLYNSSYKYDVYPSSINIGDNIIFVGTVNLDETTKDMSDRLIDRAIVINLHKQKFMDYFELENKSDNEVLICKDSKAYQSMKKKIPADYITKLYEQEIQFLDDLHEILQELNSSKGVSYRNLKKITTYLIQSPEEDKEFSRELAFDLIFKQTILKKVNGYDPSVVKLIGKIGDNNQITDSVLLDLFKKHHEVSDFKESINELRRKIKEYENYGFTR